MISLIPFFTANESPTLSEVPSLRLDDKLLTVCSVTNLDFETNHLKLYYLF